MIKHFTVFSVLVPCFHVTTVLFSCLSFESIYLAEASFLHVSFTTELEIVEHELL